MILTVSPVSQLSGVPVLLSVLIDDAELDPGGGSEIITLMLADTATPADPATG